MQVQRSNSVLFGKVPTHGDFVRHNATGAEVKRLDAWIQEGMYVLKNRCQPNIVTAYAEGSAVSMIYTAEREQPPFVGVLVPSRDQVGRSYPLVVGETLPDGAMSLEQIPVQYGAQLAALSSLASAAAEGAVSHTELVARLFQNGADHPAPDDEHERFLRDTPVTALGNAENLDDVEGQAAHVFRSVLEILSGLRGRPLAHIRYGLRIPAPEPGPRTIDFVAFWLDAAVRVLKTRDFRPCVFWCSPLRDRPVRPYVMLFFNPPPASVFPQLFSSDHEIDELYDIGKSANEAAAGPTTDLSGLGGEGSGSERRTLSELLDTIL